MSLYGNITNLSRSHFQFDKIYPNRYTMDSGLVKDEVFAGRFVLIEYDIDGEFSESDVLIGYKKESDDNIYVDVDCTKPYYYATLFAVVAPLAENWQQYYLKYGSKYPLYYKLPSEDYFNPEEQNYYKIHENYPTERIPYIVTKDQIVRIKNSDGTFTSLYYKCINTDAEPTAANVATWEQINIEQTESEYFKNYNIDKSFYGESIGYGPGNRGYDATVWQKVYSSGAGKYVLIAHLNSMVPTFVMQADAPSLYPAAPYIGAASTDMLYSVHVPTHWGFQIKEAEKVVDPITNESTYPKSDQTVVRQRKIYDEYNHEMGYANELINAEIYFNKNGTIKLTRNYDNSTLNEILITPTGESGKVYFNSNGEQVTIDTYELAIHLPVVGNLISDFYDIFYTQNRNLDTQWYNADDPQKITGNSLLNGKTRDLNSTAGLINTFQDRLGQIISPFVLNSLPSEEQIVGLSEDYIYSLYNERTSSFDYYRVGEGDVLNEVLEYEEIELTAETYEANKYYLKNKSTGAYYLADLSSFDSYLEEQLPFYKKNITYIQNDGPILEEQYEKNTYYVKNLTNNKLEIAVQPYNYYINNNNYQNISGDPVFYKKNVSNIKYVEIQLMEYEKNKYFYLDGNNYILDKHEDVPTYPNAAYYNITEDNWLSRQKLDMAYAPNTVFYKQNNNYILAKEALPEDKVYYNIEYEQLKTSSSDPSLMPYQPNKYYYWDVVNNQWVLDNQGRGFQSFIDYYYIPYDTSALISIYDVTTDRIITGYALDVEHRQYVNLQDWGSQVYVYLNNGDYIDITSLETLNVVYSEYRRIINAEEIHSFFLPNKYYTYDENEGYFLAQNFYSENYYYQLINVNPLPLPFYQGDKYYYNNGNLYLLDSEIEMIRDHYYVSSGLFVLSDSSGRYNQGFEWKDQALFVPASVTLATKIVKKVLYQIKDIDNGESSINGSILKFLNTSNFNNLITRNTQTIQGSLNSLQDTLQNFTKLYPGRILYINDFGQITASSIQYEDLKELFERVSSLEES